MNRIEEVARIDYQTVEFRLGTNQSTLDMASALVRMIFVTRGLYSSYCNIFRLWNC